MKCKNCGNDDGNSISFPPKEENDKFAYGIKFSLLNIISSGNGSRLCKNYTLYGFDNKPEDIMSFETKEEAEKVIKDIIDKSKEYYNQYKNMPKTEDTAWDYKNTIEPLFSTIKGTTGTIINSIYLKIFYLLDAEEKEDRPQYSLEAIQIIAK
jgi:hypothetical protein